MDMMDTCQYDTSERSWIRLQPWLMETLSRLKGPVVIDLGRGAVLRLVGASFLLTPLGHCLSLALCSPLSLASKARLQLLFICMAFFAAGIRICGRFTNIHHFYYRLNTDLDRMDMIESRNDSLTRSPQTSLVDRHFSLPSDLHIAHRVDYEHDIRLHMMLAHCVTVMVRNSSLNRLFLSVEGNPRGISVQLTDGNWLVRNRCTRV